MTERSDAVLRSHIGRRITIVEIVRPDATDGEDAAQVPLFDPRGLLERLGVTGAVWRHWAGQADDPQAAAVAASLAHSYPIFSKVACLPIRGPLRLSSVDVHQLLQECERARGAASGTPEAELFSAIGELAGRALAEVAEIRFALASYAFRVPRAGVIVHIGWVARRYPDSVVHLLTAEMPHGDREASVEIWDLDSLYARLGVRDGDVQRWEDSHGRGWGWGVLEDGTSFVPGFPMFSTVFWMWGTFVTLAGDELPQLIEECLRAETVAAGTPEAEILQRIRKLAERAVVEGGELEFGYQ